MAIGDVVYFTPYDEDNVGVLNTTALRQRYALPTKHLYGSDDASRSSSASSHVACVLLGGGGPERADSGHS